VCKHYGSFVEGDGVRLTFDKARNAQKTTDQFFKWETVEVDLLDRETGVLETRTSRLPIKTDTAPLDKKKLTQQQMAVLQWLAAEISRDDGHTARTLLTEWVSQPRTVETFLASSNTSGASSRSSKRPPIRLRPPAMML
jgi:hypothetical protein